MAGSIIAGSLQVEGDLNIWTSATITSSGNSNFVSVSALDYYNQNFIGSKVLVSNTSKQITESSISDTDLSYIGGVSANIQTQLNNISATKVNKTTSITAGTGLTGGGDLSTNRTISLSTTGTSGTYTKVTTNNYGQVTAGTTLTSGDIPTLPTSKIQETATDRFVSDTQIGQWDSVYSSVNSNSADWETAATNSHTHSNKTNLDLINQSLNTSASPTFAGLTVGSVSNTEISYLDSVSANIQTQLSSLSGTKTDKTTTITAGSGLTGGGDLSTNRTLSLAPTGTSGTYTKVTTNNYGQVTAGTTLTSGDIPQLPATKIGSGNISDIEFEYLNGVNSSIQTQLNSLSVNKVDKTTYVIAGGGLVSGGNLSQNVVIAMPNGFPVGTYTKVSTDQFGRITTGTTLTSGDIPQLPATKIGSGNISDIEFKYLDGVSANIQTQFNNKITTTDVKELYNWYSSRPTDCNLAPNGHGGLRRFLALAGIANGPSTTQTSHVLHIGHDNTGGYDTQLASELSTGALRSRAQTAGVWGAWNTVWDSVNLPASTTGKTLLNAADASAARTAISAAPTSHTHTLDSLSNVTITPNASGEILKWNGTAWVNNTLSEAGIQPLNSNLTALSTRQTNSLTIINGTGSGSYFPNVAAGDTVFRWGSPYTETVHLGVMSNSSGSNKSSIRFNASSVGFGHAATFDSSLTADIIYSTNNGNCTNYKVGDDAWIGGINFANTLGIKGVQDGNVGYIRFGNGGATIGYGSTNFSIDKTTIIDAPSTSKTHRMGVFTIPSYDYTLEDGKYYYVFPKAETASVATGTIYLPASPTIGSSFMIFGRNAATANGITPGDPYVHGNGKNIVYVVTNSHAHTSQTNFSLSGNTIFVFEGTYWYAFPAGRYLC